MLLTDYFRSEKDATWDIGRQCGVSHGTGQGTDLVEGRTVGQQTVARDSAVGRLQTDTAAQSRRLAGL